MRIAVIGNGQSVHVTSRSAALAAHGVAVRLVTLGPVLPAPGVEVRTRPIPRTLWAAWGAMRSFIRDVRGFDPDLLHLHYVGGRLGSLALLSQVRPLVANVMGGDVLPEQHPGGLSPRQRRTTRRLLERADLLLVKSDALARAVRTMADVGQKTHVVRWGIDPNRFYPDEKAAQGIRERLCLTDGHKVILSPRILRPLYNIHLIVDAFAEIARVVPQALLLVGEQAADDAYRRTIMARVRQRGLSDRVRLIGVWPHDEMRGLYSAADVAVMAPSSDGLPQTLLEALACAVPVVLGRLPAYSEIVEDGVSALLADLNAESIAAAIIHALSDVGLRSRLATAGRRRVIEKASLPNDVQRVVDLFHRLTAAPRPRSQREPVSAFLDLVSLARP